MTQIVTGSRLRVPLEPYRLLLLAFILLYTAIFTRLAFALHTGMKTHKADLGQIAQAVWNSSRGRFVEMTDNGFVATRLTDHVEPLLALIGPVLWLWNDVRALLLLQVVCVAVGAWFVYEVALLQVEKLLTPRERAQIWQVEPLQQLARPMALALAVAYLLAPQLQSALLTEFHAAPLAVPLILWAFWSVEVGRIGQFMMAALLLASVKEEMALLAAGLGIWAVWRVAIGDWRLGKVGDVSSVQGEKESEDESSRRPVTSLLYRPVTLSLVTFVALAWFYIATFVIVPAYAVEVYGVAESGYFARYGALGDSPADILKSFFTQPSVVWQIATEPARVNYLVGLLAPFGFLALFAPEVILLALPVLLANLLSAYAPQYYGDFHYSAPLVPYVAVAAALGMGRVWRPLARRMNRMSSSFQHLPTATIGVMNLVALVRNSRTTLRPLLTILMTMWVVVCSLSTYAHSGRGPWGGHYDPVVVTAHHRLLPRFLAQIPHDAAVTATAAVHPHVALRRFVYQFPMGVTEGSLSAPGFAPGRAPEFALLDVTTNTDMAPGDVKARVDEMLAGAWGVVDGADGFLLLQRGGTSKEIPAAFYDFARDPHADASRGQPNGREPLQFIDVAIHDWPRWRQTQVEVRWRIGSDFDPALHRPLLELRTPNSDLLYTLSMVTPPALIWYPPERWQPGELVRITTLAMTLPTTWGVVVNGEATPNLADNDGALGRGVRVIAAILQRQTDNRLSQIDGGRLLTGRADTGLDSLLAVTHPPVVAMFRLSDGREIRLDAWGEAGQPWPTGVVNLLLDWHGPSDAIFTWPQNYQVFVHVRNQSGNLIQSDGVPRFFLEADSQELIGPIGHGYDWRQLVLPGTQDSAAVLSLVIGLYEAQSGIRAEVINARGEAVGNEIEVGKIELRPRPVPDQACAMLTETCASQMK